MITLTALLALASAAAAGELRVTTVDAAGKPVAGAVVWAHGLPVSPAPGDAVMDQVGMEFTPHVLAVRVGARVTFPNKDQVHHHLYSFSKAKRFELPLYKGKGADPVLFDEPGVVKLGCNIHDWMFGYLVVVPNAHFAVTGADGQAVLTLPEGTKEVAVWSERVKGAEPAVHPVAGGALAVTLKAGSSPKPRPRAGSESMYR